MSDTFNATADLIGDVAAPYVLIAQAGRSIGGIVPNVTVQEVVVDENTITQHPVQSGAPVSDHVFRNPVVVDMVPCWSDSTGAYPGYSADIYAAVLALRDTRQPFDVYTPQRMFPNMLFGTITKTTDESSEYALMLRVRLQEVIISDTATASGGATSANQADPASTGGTQNMGQQVLVPFEIDAGNLGGSVPAASATSYDTSTDYSGTGGRAL